MESLAGHLLGKLLGPYFEGIVAEKLRVGVWSGNVVLSDLALRYDALDGLELPLELIRGRVGRLQLRVPWSRIRSEPVELVFEDVVLETRIRESPSADAFVRREQMRKRLRLDAEELLQGLRESASAGDANDRTSSTAAPANDSFMGRLARAVIDNLRLTLVRVQVRCEQAGGGAWGATLQRFEMLSTDSAGLPEYQSASSGEQPWLFKLLVLSGATIHHFQPSSEDASLSLASRRLSSGQRPPYDSDARNASVILEPMDISMQFRMLRAGASVEPEEPRTRCTCRLAERLTFSVTEHQCVLLLQLSSHLSRLAKRERYERFRPRVQDHSAGRSPAAWWQYAHECVRSELNGRRRWRSWAAVKQHIQRRREYIGLWQLFLKGDSPMASASSRLMELEDELDLSDILLFRALARQVRTPSAGAGILTADSPTHWQDSAGPRAQSPLHVSTPPRRAPRAITRSVSEGELSPSIRSPSMVHTASEAQLQRADDAGDCSARTPSPEHSSGGHGLRQRSPRTGWLGWLRHGPYLLRSAAYAEPDCSVGNSDLGLSPICDLSDGLPSDTTVSTEPPGYAPLHVSLKQQQQLRLWMDRAGVLKEERAEAVQRAPVQWQLHLDMQAICLRLTCSATPSQDTGDVELCTAVLEASSFQLQQQSDLEGSASSRLQIAAFSVWGSLSNDLSGSTLHPLVSARTAASDSTPALTLAHRSWPATVGAWLAESSYIRARSEAGSQLDVKVLPLCFHLFPAAVTGIRHLLDECTLATGEVPSGPLLPAPPRSDRLAFTMQHSVVLLSHTKDAVVELEVSELMVETHPGSNEPCQRISHAGPALPPPASSGDLLQRTQTQMCLREISASLRTGSRTFCLAEPFTCTVNTQHTSYATMREREDATVHVTAIRFQMDAREAHTVAAIARAVLMPEMPAGRVGSKQLPEHAHVALNAPRPSGGAASSTTQRTCNVSLEYLAINASCGTALQIVAHAHETSLHVCVSGDQSDLDVRLTSKTLTADIGTMLCQVPHLQARGVGLECTCESHQGSANARMELGSLAVHSIDEQHPVEAVTFRMPSNDSESAYVLCATIHPGLVDVTASISAPQILVADPDSCAQLVHGLLSACSAIPTASEPPTSRELTAGNGSALAVQLDSRGCVVRLATGACVPCSETASASGIVSVQVGATWLTALLDRSGGQHCDGELGNVRICSVLDAEPVDLLEPLSISWRALFPMVAAVEGGAASGGQLQLHLSEARIRLPNSLREHLQGLVASLRAPWLSSASRSGGVRLEAVAACKPSSTSPELRRRPFDFQLRLTSLSVHVGPLQASVARFCFRSRTSASQQSTACSFDALSAQLEGTGSAFFTMGSSPPQPDGGDQPATVRVEVETLHDNSMLACLSCRGLQIRLSPEELNQLLPLCTFDFEMPAASDVAFSAELDLADARLAFADHLPETTAEVLTAIFSLKGSAFMAGGVREPARAKYLMSLDRVGVELLRDATSTQLLLPFASVLRMHACKGRIRAAAQTSDIEVQLSTAQLQAIARVAKAVFTCFEGGDKDAAVDAITPFGGMTELALTPEPSPSSDTLSEASEYFDARDFIDDEPTPSELQAAVVDDIEAAAQLGQVIITLLEDSVSATSPPILQFTLDASRCLGSQRPGTGLTMSARVQLCAYHYVRASARTSQRWEPVLAACRFDLTVDTARRAVDACARGTAEVDVSTRLIGSLHRLTQQALSAGSTLRLASSGAPFVVKNDTGTAMVVWVDDGMVSGEGQRLTEVQPGGVAYLPETPMQLEQSGRRVLVIFQGFQQLDIRPTCPPYVRRYRLWPAAERLGSPAIVNVLLDSREENGAELCTFHSRFVLFNSCKVNAPTARACLAPLHSSHAALARVLVSLPQDEVQVSFVPKEASNASTISQVQPREQMHVPLACHHGWLRLGLNAAMPSDVWESTNEEGCDIVQHELEVSPASLEVLAGRGISRLQARGRPADCYLVQVSPMLRPAYGWMVSIHEPLVLNNGLLCDLEYEVSEGSERDVLHGGEPELVHVGKLESGAEVSFRMASSFCVLRTSCDGFRWSQRVRIDLSVTGNHAPAVEHRLSHPAQPNNAKRSAELHLTLRVAHGPGVVAEVVGRVWVVNECHLPLRLAVAGRRPCSVLVPSVDDASPSALGVDAEASRGAAVLLPAGDEPLPQLFLYEGVSSKPRRGSGAFVSLRDLLHLAAPSEGLLLDVKGAGMHMSAEHQTAQGGATASLPRLLHLGVKLRALPTSSSGSFVLVVSPRIMVLNKTGRALVCCQRGCATNTALPCNEWVPLHWHDPQRPREVLFRRLDRGSEWSGAVSMGTITQTDRVLEPGSVGELTLRLRNLECGSAEFVRLAWQQLTKRASIGLMISDASEHGAPIIIQNQTKYGLHCQQVGVPVVSVVAAGQLLAYAWDEPARKKQLLVRLPALSIRFRCGTMPCTISRPRFASILGRAAVELLVRDEGAVMMVVVRHAPATERALPLSRAISLPHTPSGPSSAGGNNSRIFLKQTAPPLAAQGVIWSVKVQLPDLRMTLLDHESCELLHLSLRGLRGQACRRDGDAQPIDSFDLALASLQVDCQLPRTTAKEEVLLRAGVAAPGDAVDVQLSLTRQEDGLVLQRALASLQQITLRVDEELLDVIAASLHAVIPASKSEAIEVAVPDGEMSHADRTASRRAACSMANMDVTLLDELSMLREEPIRHSQRVFVEHFRFAAVPVKLSLQHASRPDTTATNAGGLQGAPEEQSISPAAGALRWLRWVGITLIGLDEVPLLLPEVALQRASISVDGLLNEVQQQYARALLQQAYKLLPSAALLGDPYGMLRNLQQGWLKHRQALRHAPWSSVPAVAVECVADMLKASAASILHATGKSARALSKSLEGLLEQQHLELSMPEAVLIGIGGSAREASRAIELTLHTIKERRGAPLPDALEVALAVGLLPWGFYKASNRLALLLSIGALRWMRSTADAFRSVLGPKLLETGRLRPARPMGAPALYSTCVAADAVEEKDRCSLICATLVEPPSGRIVITPRGMVQCIAKIPDDESPATLWQCPLSRLLLVQQRGRRVHLLTLAPTAAAAVTTASHSVEVVSDEDAGRLHDILRLSALNAKGMAIPPSPSLPLLRATLLAAPRRTRRLADPTVLSAVFDSL